MPPNMSSSLGLQLLTQVKKGDWRLCLQTLKGCAAAGSDLAAIPSLPTVLTALVADGHWREVLTLQPDLLTEGASSRPQQRSATQHPLPSPVSDHVLSSSEGGGCFRSDGKHAAVAVLLDAATCPDAVEAADDHAVHRVYHLLQLIAAEDITLTEALLQQATKALQTWQRQARFAGNALLDDSLTLLDAQEPLPTADAPEAHDGTTEATTAAVATARVSESLAAISRRLDDVALDRKTSSSSNTTPTLPRDVRSLQSKATHELRACQRDHSEAAAALLLYTCARRGTLLLRDDVIDWACDSLLASTHRATTPTAKADQNVSLLILCTTRLLLRRRGARDGEGGVPEWLPLLRDADTRAAVTERSVRELIHAVLEQYSAGINTVWQGVVASFDRARPLFLTPAPESLRLDLLTEAARAIALTRTTSRHEQSARAVAALLDAVTQAVQTGRCTCEDVTASLSQLWRCLVGDAAWRQLCPGGADDVTPSPRQGVSSTHSPLLADVAPHMLRFHAWMRVSAAFLGHDAASAPLGQFSGIVHSIAAATDGTDALVNDGHSSTRDGVDDAEGRHDEVLLSAHPHDRATSRSPLRDDEDDSDSVHHTLSDTVATWYARVMHAMLEQSEAQPNTLAGLAQAVASPVQAVVAAAGGVLADHADNDLRVAVYLALTGVVVAPQNALVWPAAVRDVHSFLLALPPSTTTVGVCQQLLHIRLPSSSAAATNDVNVAAAVLRLAATAALQHARSNLSLEQKSRAVRQCLGSFPSSASSAGARSTSQTTTLSASQAALLVLRCDPASFQRQHDATKALTSVLGAPATLDLGTGDDDTGDAAQPPRRRQESFGRSTSSLDQVLHVLVEQTKPPRWADALAVIAEASLATSSFSPCAASLFGAGGSDALNTTSKTSDVRSQMMASLLAAAHGDRAVPLRAPNKRTSQRGKRDDEDVDDDLADLLSIRGESSWLSVHSATGTPLTTAEHDGLREELRPLRASSRVNAAVQIFYRLERDGRRLSLAELEWFAFAVKRGPLVFAVRVLDYADVRHDKLGGLDADRTAPASSSSPLRKVTSRSLGMAAVQCAANVYMRARTAAASTTATTPTPTTTKATRHSKTRHPSHPPQRTARGVELRLVAYQCRTLAAQGVQLLPRYTSDAQQQLRRHPTRHDASATATAAAADVPESHSRFVASLGLDCGDMAAANSDSNNSHATARSQGNTHMTHAAQDFQRLVTAVRRLSNNDAEAARLFLLGTGAYDLLGVQEAAEVLEHTVAFCVEAGDRDTAMRAYLRFRDTWSHAPVSQAVLRALLQLECDYVRDNAAAATPDGIAAHGTTSEGHHTTSSRGGTATDGVETRWGTSQQKHGRSQRHKQGGDRTGAAVPPASSSAPPPPPLQVTTLVGDGLRMAREGSWRGGGVDRVSHDPAGAPLADFIAGVFDVVFGLRRVPSLTARHLSATSRYRDTLLAAVVRSGNGLLPMRLFMTTENAFSLPLDAVTVQHLLTLCARSVTQTEDTAAVLEGTSVFLGALDHFPSSALANPETAGVASSALATAPDHKPRKSRSKRNRARTDSGRHTSDSHASQLYQACTDLLAHVAAIAHRPAAPPLYVHCVETAFGRAALRRRSDANVVSRLHSLYTMTPTQQALSGSVSVLASTEAQAYAATYDALAAPLGFRTFADVEKQSMTGLSDTPFACALSVSDRLHQLDQALARGEAPHATTGRANNTFALLCASAHIAMDAIHTDLAVSFETVASESAHQPTVTLWLDACVESFATAIGLLARAEDALQTERLDQRNAKFAHSAETAESTFARRAAAEHVSEHLEQASTHLLDDLAVWWRAVTAGGSPSDASACAALAEPARRQTLVWLVTILCRLEWRRSAHGHRVSGRVLSLASVVEPLQRALVLLVRSDDYDAAQVPGSDEQLVMDVLAAACDVLVRGCDALAPVPSSAPPRLRSQHLQAVLAAVQGTDGDGDQVAATSPQRPTADGDGETVQLSMLLWEAIPVLLHLSDLYSASGSTAESRKPWHSRQDAILAVLRSHHCPPPAVSHSHTAALSLPCRPDVLTGPLWCMACVQAAHAEPPLCDASSAAAVLDSALSATLLGNNAARIAHACLSGGSLSGSAWMARVPTPIIIACLAPCLEANPAQSFWRDTLHQIGTHQPDNWPLAKQLLLDSPFVVAPREPTEAATVFANLLAERTSVVLSSFGPWPPQVLLELVVRLQQATQSVPSSPPIRSAWHLLHSLMGVANRDAPAATLDDNVSTTSLFSAHDSAQAARQVAARMWSSLPPDQAARHGANDVPASVTLTTVAEAVLNAPLPPPSLRHEPRSAGTAAAAALVPQRALMEQVRLSPAVPTLCAAMVEAVGVAASRKDRRYPHHVPTPHASALPRQEEPVLAFPTSQFVSAAALRTLRRCHPNVVRDSSDDVAWRAQLRLPTSVAAVASSPPAAEPSADIRNVMRVTPAADIALASSQAAAQLRPHLFRIACATDAVSLCAAIDEMGTRIEKQRATSSAVDTSADGTLVLIWHTTLARLTELTVHQQRIHKRSPSQLHATLVRPVLQAALALCRVCEGGADSLIAAEVMGHYLASAVDARLTGSKHGTAHSSVTPSRQQVEAMLADSSFVRQLTQEVFPLSPAARRDTEDVETVRHTLRRVFTTTLTSGRQSAAVHGDQANALWEHSLWPPALWERLQLNELGVETEHCSSPCVLTVRHPVVVCDVVRLVASGAHRVHHVNTRWPSTANETERRPLREAADMVRQYCETGLCTLSTSRGTRASSVETSLPPPTSSSSSCAGASLVLDDMTALLSEWGHRGGVANARRDGEWVSVVRFMVDEMFPAATRPGLFSRYVPISWSNVIGLIVERIGFDQRGAPSVDYAESVLTRLQAYAAAQTHAQQTISSIVAGSLETYQLRPLAWSRQNWQVLLHFFLQTHALAVTFLASSGWHTARQATVDASWTALLSFLALVTATGHGSVNLWTPRGLNALLAAATISGEANNGATQPYRDGGEGENHDESRQTLSPGAWTVTSVVHRCCAEAPSTSTKKKTDLTPAARRVLTSRGLQRFFSGVWRSSPHGLDKRLRDLIAQDQHTEEEAPHHPYKSARTIHRLNAEPQLPRTAALLVVTVKEAAAQRGEVPSHAVLSEVLALVLNHVATSQSTEEAAGWRQCGLDVCDCLCPFMAMTPALMEQIFLLLHTAQDAMVMAGSAPSTNGETPLVHYLARYQSVALLTPTSVAVLMQLYHAQKRTPSQRDASLETTLLIRAVQGIQSLSECDMAWLRHSQHGTLTTAVLESIRTGCVSYVAESPHHAIAHDDMFLAAGRRLDNWLAAGAVAWPWFTQSICDAMAGQLEAHATMTAPATASDPPLAPLPPLARMLRLYDVFQADRTTRTSMVMSTEAARAQVHAADATQWRFLSALFQLSARPPPPSSVSVAGRRARAATATGNVSLAALTWARALRLLFPTITTGDQRTVSSTSSAQSSVAADALRLLTRERAPQQWQVAVQLFDLATSAAGVAPTVPDHNLSHVRGARPERPTALAYQLLQYVEESGDVARMPLAVLEHTLQHLVRLEQQEEEREEQQSQSNAAPLTVSAQQQHNRASVIDALARVVSARADLTLTTATSWCELLKHLESCWERRRRVTAAPVLADDSPPLPRPWRTFVSQLAERLAVSGEGTMTTTTAALNIAATSPLDRLMFALTCGVTQGPETQRWLVHTASLAAPTRVPAVLELFTAPDTRLAPEADSAAALKSKQSQLAQLVAEDAADVSAAHTTLLSDLLLRRPKDGESAREAARVCQLHPSLLTSDAFQRACGSLAEDQFDVKLTLFFTALLTPVAAAIEAEQTAASALARALPTVCVKRALESYTRLFSQQQQREPIDSGRTETELSRRRASASPTWWSPAVLLMAELAARIPWHDELSGRVVSTAGGELAVLHTASLLIAEQLFGAKTAAVSLAPLVFFGRPANDAARDALTPLYAAIEAHLVPATVKAARDGRDVHDTVALLAALCVSERPALSVTLWSTCVPHAARPEAGQQVAAYRHYAEQRAVKHAALQACEARESTAQQRLALQWRDQDFFSHAVVVDAELDWCARLNEFVVAAEVLGHLDGTRLMHIQRLIDVIDAGVASGSGFTSSLALHAALLQWWWSSWCTTQAFTLTVPVDHAILLVRHVARHRDQVCQTVPESATCAAEHWVVTRELNSLALSMAQSMAPAAGSRGTRALGQQLVSLLTVMASLDTHTVASLKDAVHVVLEWTGQGGTHGAAIDRGVSAALRMSRVLLEQLIQQPPQQNDSMVTAASTGRLPSLETLQQVLVPQLCRDGLALTLDSVRNATAELGGGAEAQLDEDRLYLLLSSAALINEVALKRGYTTPRADAMDCELRDTLTFDAHILHALRPYVLLRLSEQSLTLLRLECIRARGRDWRPLFAQLTDSTSTVSVRAAVFSPAEEASQQAGLLHVLTRTDRSGSGHQHSRTDTDRDQPPCSYDAAWSLCTERREQGLRLNWPCYASLWRLATAEADEKGAEETGAPSSSSSSSSSSLSTRWERTESWFYALLRDGVVIPEAAALDSVVAYIVRGGEVSAETAPYIRHLAALVSVMPHVTADGGVRGEGASPSFVSTVVDACAAAEPPAGDLLGRFVQWYVDCPVPSSSLLRVGTLEKAVAVLCACQPPLAESATVNMTHTTSGSAEETAHTVSPPPETLTVAALLQRALWANARERHGSRWRDDRARLALWLPGKANVLAALRLVEHETKRGTTPVPPQTWDTCVAAVGAVLFANPRESEAEELVQVCVHRRVVTPACGARTALVLAEQSLWHADLRAIRREAAFARPRRPRAGLDVSDPIDKAFTGVVLRHVWRQYAETLPRLTPASDTLYHAAILEARPTTPQDAAVTANPAHFEHAQAAVVEEDNDEDAAALEEVMNGLRTAATTTTTTDVQAPRAAAASTTTTTTTTVARLRAVAVRLQSLRDLLLHAEPSADLQYPFDVVMTDVLQVGRWMEAFAWLESASLTPAQVTVRDDDSTEADASLLDYASLGASNAEQPVPGAMAGTLCLPADAVRLPTPPVSAVASHTTLGPLLVWMLVEGSQTQPALSSSSTVTTSSAAADGARVSELRRQAVLSFAETWMRCQREMNSHAHVPTAGLVWALVTDEVQAQNRNERP